MKTIHIIKEPNKESALPSLLQLTPSQEMAEAFLPKHPEPAQDQMANEPPKRRKGAFRRNPLLATPTALKSLPVEESLSTSAADGISSLQADTEANQEGNIIRGTPRGSKWSIRSLFQSARSIKRQLGFNPSAPSTESSAQTPTTSTAQTLTETTAPTQPKKSSSLPTSARDTRARNRRHNDSAIKPVKPVAGGKSQVDRASRGKEASPPSGEIEAPGAEEDNTPVMDEVEEAIQGQIDERSAWPTIRWPSRTLDRMNKNKRKLWGESAALSSPESGSYCFSEADLYGDSEEDGVIEKQRGKIRRTRGSQEFTSQVAGDPNPAQPYTPTKLQHSAMEYQGGNVFAEYEAAQRAANTGQPLARIQIPITNSTGSFKVPSPGDSDWSDSRSEDEAGNTAGWEDISPSLNKNGEFASPNPCDLPLKFPMNKPIPLPTQSEALRKARGKFLKHKPRNPGRLSQSTKAPVLGEADISEFGPNSPVLGETNKRKFRPEAAVSSNAGQAGRTNQYTSFDEWSRTAPPAVIAVLENMEVGSNFAGRAFESGLDNFNDLE